MANYQKQLDNQLEQARERGLSREFAEKIVTTDNPQRELDSLVGSFFVEQQLEHFFAMRGDETELKKFLHGRLSPEIE